MAAVFLLVPVSCYVPPINRYSVHPLRQISADDPRLIWAADPENPHPDFFRLELGRQYANELRSKNEAAFVSYQLSSGDGADFVVKFLQDRGYCPNGAKVLKGGGGGTAFVGEASFLVQCKKQP